MTFSSNYNFLDCFAFNCCVLPLIHNDTTFNDSTNSLLASCLIHSIHPIAASWQYILLLLHVSSCENEHPGCNHRHPTIMWLKHSFFLPLALFLHACRVSKQPNHITNRLPSTDTYHQASCSLLPNISMTYTAAFCSATLPYLVISF